MINHNRIDRDPFRFELQAEIFHRAEGRSRLRIVCLEWKRGSDIEVEGREIKILRESDILAKVVK